MQNPQDFDARRFNWKKRVEKGGTFLAILAFNAVILLLLGSTVIIRAIIHHQEDAMVFAKLPPPPPPPVKPPSLSGGKGSLSHTDVTTDIKPPRSTVGSVVTTTASVTSFQSISAPVMPVISLPSMTDPGTTSLDNDHSPAHNSMNPGNALFGVPDPNGVPMMAGYLYDLKQTSDGKPTNFTTKDYHQALRNFVARNWDQSSLDKYYKFSKPLFTPQIYIPNIKADLGPTQFGAEKEVEPRMWVAYYKVTVVPPQDGEYQFYGTCDDIIIARVNGRTVLDGSLTTVSGLKETATPFDLLDENTHMYGSLKQGIPFRVTAGVPVEINVMIGEEPGGWFNSFLLLGDTTVKYTTGPNGMPKIPVFQVATSTVPDKGMRLDAGPPVLWPAQAAQ